MRKPTFAEAYMYKNLLWLSIGVFIFVPFLNDFLLQFLFLYTKGDIAYGNLGAFITATKNVLSLTSVYVGLGIFIATVINFGKNARGVIELSHATYIVSFLSSALTCILYSYVSYGYGISEDVLMQIIALAIDAAVNLAVHFVIYIILIRITKRKETVLNTPSFKGRYTDVSHPLVLAAAISISISSGAQLLITLFNMITDFTDPSIGPPINIADVMYWVMQYLSVFAFAAIGFITVELVFILSEHYVKSGRKKGSNKMK